MKKAKNNMKNDSSSKKNAAKPKEDLEYEMARHMIKEAVVITTPKFFNCSSDLFFLLINVILI